MTRRLLYISGPFSDPDNLHGVERNILLASEAALARAIGQLQESLDRAGVQA